MWDLTLSPGRQCQNCANCLVSGNHPRHTHTHTHELSVKTFTVKVQKRRYTPSLIKPLTHLTNAQVRMPWESILHCRLSRTHVVSPSGPLLSLPLQLLHVLWHVVPFQANFYKGGERNGFCPGELIPPNQNLPHGGDDKQMPLISTNERSPTDSAE